MKTAYVFMGIVWSFIILCAEYERKDRFDTEDIGRAVTAFMIWPVLNLMFFAILFVKTFRRK